MSRGTAHRGLRVDDDLWNAAKVVAQERGESLAEVLRQALRDYIAQNRES